MATPATRGLSAIYRDYIRAILNHDLDSMDHYVSDSVVHNGKQLGLHGYKEFLLRNIVQNDVQVEIKRLVADDNHVAAILIFTTRPSSKGVAGIQFDGRPFSYAENVIYDFKDGKIAEVHSLFDIDTVRSHARPP